MPSSLPWLLFILQSSLLASVLGQQKSGGMVSFSVASLPFETFKSRIQTELGLRTQGWTCHIYVNNFPTFICFACVQVTNSVGNVKRTYGAVNTTPQGQNSKGTKRKRAQDTWKMSKNNGNLSDCLHASCPEGYFLQWSQLTHLSSAAEPRRF